MDARTWDLLIPVRPKAVQSTRFAGHAYADPKVRAWKESVIPYVESVCSVVGGPTTLPVRVVRLDHIFKCPKRTPKRVVEYIRAGGTVPVVANVGDVMDNLNKGLMDVCLGRVFVDDKQVWTGARVSKVYGLDYAIHLVLEETPDVIMIDGKTGCGQVPADLFC